MTRPIDAGAGPRLHLVRAVGLAGLIAISLNGVIGSGIFVLPATVASLLGPSSPIAYIIAGGATVLIVLCFAEAGSMFERTGGPYLYAKEAFGPFIGFEIGWMFLLTRLAAAAAISNAFAAYLGYFWPAFATGIGRIAAITLLLLGLALVNLIGIKQGSLTVNVLTVAKMLPLLLFIGAGLFSMDSERYSFLSIPNSSDLRQASLALIFAFGGFENASVPSEEVKNPRKSLPIALLCSISVTALIYILIQIVALGTLPNLAGDPTPLASASRMFLGQVGAAVITLGAILSTAGSNSALVLVGPRILFAMGEAGHLPRALSQIHHRFLTPHISIAAFTIATWVVALYGDFGELVAMSAIARLVFSTSTCLAIPVLRRKRGREGRGFILPGGMLIPLMAAIISIWLLTAVSRKQAIAGLVGLAVGCLLYSVLRLPRLRRFMR